MASYFNYEDLTVSTIAVGATAATRGAATVAVFYVEGAVVRFKFGTPTASSGQELYPGDTLLCDSADEVSRVQFISRDGSTATVRCHYGMR